MSTETKSENTSTTIDNKTNNKALFGPLGKYAIAGVIMVSIMITTVILLNKQLGTATEHIANIEKESAESNDAESKVNESTASIDTTSTIESENNQTQDTIEVAEVEVTPVQVEAAAVQTTEVPATDANKVPVATEATDTVTSAEKTTSDTDPNTEQASTAAQQAPSTTQVATQVAIIEPAKADTVVKNTVQTPLPQLATDYQDQQWQTRIQAHKLEQKQRMTEMFSRIRSLESQHLDQYKVHQDEQVEHLREQIARQQELIEELILRNKESYEMREASMQRHQTNREQILNRI